MTRTPHCIVIGAGIVGSSCAWHLQRAGTKVTLIDPILPGQATSFGNAGCIGVTGLCPSSYPGIARQVPGWLLDPMGPMKLRWSQLFSLAPWLWRYWRSGSPGGVDKIVAAQAQLMSTVIEDYDFILAETASESLRRTGGQITLYNHEAELAEDQWHYDIMRQYDMQWQRLSRQEFHELEPDIPLGDEGIAVLDSAWQFLLSPADVVAKIAESALSQGTQYVQDRVSRIESGENAVVVETRSGQRLNADFLVMASGVWTNELLAQLGHRVPLMAKRGYHSMLSQPNVSLSHAIRSHSRSIMMIPMRDGLRITGMAEFANVDTAADYRLAKVPLHHAKAILPGLAGTEITEWMGQRPMMSDSLPVIGFLPGHQRVVCAFGHGHYGITQGPNTGRIVADLVTGRTPHIDLSPFSMSRF